MVEYRLDPKNPRQLTDEEQRRLDEAPIDYSDIGELDAEFFAKARHPMLIDWSRCPDVERTPGKVSGAWCVKGTRCPVWAIMNNADSTAEEIADMFEVPVQQVRRILLFAYKSELNSLFEAHLKGRADYYRAGVLVKKVAEIARALQPRPTRKPTR
jgi:uncharacterized protein (DUF433 family)